MKLMHVIYILIALFASGCNRQAPPTDYTRFYQEIRSGNKMVFASMAITKTVKSERSDWYKVGKRIAVYSYDSYLQAYIDLSEIEIDDLKFDEEKKTVTVTLPPIRTELAGRDMEMRKEYENIGLLRSEVGAQERARLKEMANSSLKQEIVDNPEFKRKLVESARRKARSYFETLFNDAGYTADIRFSDDPSSPLREP